MDAATRRIALEKFRTLLGRLLAEIAHALVELRRLQMIVAPAARRFDEIYNAHSRREFMPAKVAYFKDEVKGAKAKFDEFERMFGDDDNPPPGYVGAVKGDALKAAGGDENAVEVANDARYEADQMEYTLEHINDDLDMIGGGGYVDLFESAKGTIEDPGVRQVQPAPGNVAMYQTVADGLQVLHARLQALSEKVEEMVKDYKGTPGELFVVADGDDVEEVDHVKQMYSRCLRKLIGLTETRRGLECVLMDLSGHFEPERSPEPESEPEPE